MGDQFEADPPVWIWKPDGSGTEVETDLLAAARKNWGRMLAYARRYEPDSSVAEDILEGVLRATSKARKKHPRPNMPIRNLDNYLYVAFVRRLGRYLKTRPPLVYVGTSQDLRSIKGIQKRSQRPTIEDDVLARELLQYMNPRARRTFFLRKEAGYSWRDTAKLLKTTANSAQVLFHQAMDKVRARIMKRKGRKSRPGERGEGHA
jgi:RNA polymerase sigma factor (sigma-70 family)